METHPKIRLDILIEAPFRKRLCAVLDEEGVSGYTFFSALGGKGVDGAWSREGLVSEVGGNLHVVCVLDAERRGPVLDRLAEEFAAQIGYVLCGPVDVVRPQKFP
ncbi:MAG: hypothetical protein AAFR16_01480 [Pseudomonadota bacterium]